MGKKKTEELDEDKKPGAEPAPKPEPEEEPLLVAVDEDEDDEDATPAERPSSRREKKSNRFREAQERAEAAIAEAEAYKTELARARALIQAPPQGQPKDEAAEALERNRKAQEEVSQTFEALQASKRLTPEEHKRLLDRAIELQDERAELIHRRSAARNAPPRVDPMVAHFQASAADVFAHPRASAWAKARYEMQLATEGGRVSTERDLEIAMAAADEARKQFRLGSYRGGPPASEGQRRKYEGPSRSAPAHSDSRPSRTVDMSNKRFRQMANAAYSHIKDEKKRMEMWAKGPGKAMLDNQAE